MNKLRIFLFLLLLIPVFAFSQTEEKNLHKHLEYLASDKLHGRLTGTKYERMAGDYIAKQFETIGLLPMQYMQNSAPMPFDTRWFQTFEFSKGLSYGKDNSFKVNDTKYKLEKDYYPVPYSAEGTLSGDFVDVGYGINDPKSGMNTYEGMKNLEGKIFLINLSNPEGGDSKKYAEMDWRARLEMAKQYKPAGIIFYNSKDPLNLAAFKKFNNIQRENIVMIHTTPEIVKNIISNKGAKISINVNLENNKGEGRNVGGFIDNGKSTTIVIGAHYDHLGMGEMGNSLYSGKPAIHNGADDNASGVAALIELARIIKQNGPTNHNYLFIAFSGEELGLIGSKNFTSNPTIALDHVDYMLNMDMVGRLDSMKLALSGTGTSPSWDSVISSVMPGKFKIKESPSGVGPSDHSSFYMKNIPVLHFFTGSHADYHKPSDDIDKINFPGMADVTNYIYAIVKQLDRHPKLVFVKTKDDTATRVKFKVTLGIIPDYMYDKGGLRADGVSSGKPAEKAGMKAGDVIIKLGDYEVKDMGGYMSALSKFHKGDITEVTIIRDGKEMKLKVTF